MRLFVINCLLLASLAAALPNVRHKRDFSTIRKWIRSNFFDHPRQINIQASKTKSEKNYQLFRLPGYDNILIRVSSMEENAEPVTVSVAKPVDLEAFSKVVGTKDREDTVKSLKEVNNLVSSGILIDKGNDVIRESLIPMFSNIPNYVRNEEAMVETIPIFESKEPSLTEVDETVKIEVPIVPKYSYIQLENNKPAMVYTAHYNRPVATLTESVDVQPVVPNCIRERVDEIIQWGANPVRAVFPELPEQLAEIPNASFDADPNMKNIFFPVIETENISADIAAELGVLPHLGNRPYYFHKERPVKSRPINPRPVQLFSHKPSHSFAKPTTGVPQSDGDADRVDSRIGISKTLGPIPPQYVHEITSTTAEVKIAPKADRTTTVEDYKDTITNAMIPTRVYNTHSVPATTVPLKEDGLKTNKEVKPKGNAPSYFYYVPPTVRPDSTRNQFSASTIHKAAYTNKISTSTQKVVESKNSTTTTTQARPLKSSPRSLFKNNPIVVPDDKKYMYVQKNLDGSVMTTKSNQKEVSVDISENKSKYRARGDIPNIFGEK